MSTSASSDSDSSQPVADPTRTATQRERLRQQLSARTREVRGQVRQQIESQQQGSSTGTLAGVAAAGVGGYAFLRSLSAFRRWLTRMFENAFALRVAPRQARRGSHWTASFVRDSYETGLRRSRAVLRQQGYDIGDRGYEAVVTDGGHQRTLRGLYERAVMDLDDAASNAVQELSRTIADNEYIGAGSVSRRELVDTLTERIRAQFGKRIRHVADIVPVRSANTAAIQSYSTADVEQVGIDPETADESTDVDWQTVGDANVCATCRRLARNGPYKLTAVLAGDPAPPPSPHPGCRCWVVAL